MVGVAKRGRRWILLRSWRPCPAEKCRSGGVYSGGRCGRCNRLVGRGHCVALDGAGVRVDVGRHRGRGVRARIPSADSFSAAAASPAPPCSSGLPRRYGRKPGPAAAVVRGLPGPVPGVCRDRLSAPGWFSAASFGGPCRRPNSDRDDRGDHRRCCRGGRRRPAQLGDATTARGRVAAGGAQLRGQLFCWAAVTRKRPRSDRWRWPPAPDSWRRVHR